MYYFIFFNLKLGYWDYLGVDSDKFIPKFIPIEDKFDSEEMCKEEIIKRDNGFNHYKYDQFYHYVYQNDEGTWKPDETFSLEASSVKRIPKERIIVMGRGDSYLMKAKLKAYDLNRNELNLEHSC